MEMNLQEVEVGFLGSEGKGQTVPVLSTSLKVQCPSL